jgi:hypothetical protein
MQNNVLQNKIQPWGKEGVKEWKWKITLTNVDSALVNWGSPPCTTHKPNFK